MLSSCPVGQSRNAKQRRPCLMSLVANPHACIRRLQHQQVHQKKLLSWHCASSMKSAQDVGRSALGALYTPIYTLLLYQDVMEDNSRSLCLAPSGLHFYACSLASHKRAPLDNGCRTHALDIHGLAQEVCKRQTDVVLPQKCMAEIRF